MPVEYNGGKFVALGERLAAANGWNLKVGIVGAKAHEIEEGSSLTLAALWFIHEYGTDHVPERAPLRKTMIARRDEIAVLLRKIAAGIYAGKVDPEQAMGLLGLRVVSWIKLTITSGVDPANAPSTIARKKSSKPLVDDGQLVNSVTHLVEHAGVAAAAAAAIADVGEVAA